MKHILTLLIFPLIVINIHADEDADFELLVNGHAKYSVYSQRVYFIENQGQLNNEVEYYVCGLDKDLYFTKEGVTFVLKSNKDDNNWVIKLQFLNIRNNIKPVGRAQYKTNLNYFKGKEKYWKTGIPTYLELVYKNAWPGIDVIFKGIKNKVKYSFIVKEGFDPSKIKMKYVGASDVVINDDGGLVIITPEATMVDNKPFAYQENGGNINDVMLSYSLNDNQDNGSYQYGFKVGDFDSSLPLVIDPALFVYCGYIGGSQEDAILGIDVDEMGCAYVTGVTASSTFPTKIGPDTSYNGGEDAFVAKISSDGTGLEYCGFIGGDKPDKGYDIFVDNYGDAYVVGSTKSSEDSFPVKVGPDLSYSGQHDGFIAKINSEGTDIIYCGYIGGVESDTCTGVSVDSGGEVFITGSTNSNELTFPVYVGPDISHNGKSDTFIAKIKSNGLSFEFCGYIGGNDDDSSSGITIDQFGNIVITGFTKSDELSFPVIIGPDMTFNGGPSDAFITKVIADGTGILFSGFIGGIGSEGCEGIDTDGNGNIYVTGHTNSDENTFPVNGGPDITFNGNDDAFVTKISMDGSAIEYCGYIGGSSYDYGHGISVDNRGIANIVGTTGSLENDFPITNGPDLTFNGNEDAFIARINEDGSDLDFCGYIGGSKYDTCLDIELDKYGHSYVSGYTKSNQLTFPVVIGPDLSYNGNGTEYDGFVAKIAMPLSVDIYSLSEGGGVIDFSISSGSENLNRNYLLLSGLSGTYPGFQLPGGYTTLPLNWDAFTDIVLGLTNSPTFSSFLAQLDAHGNANAQLNSPKLPPGFVGTIMYYAYCINNPFNFASNPVVIEIVP